MSDQHNDPYYIILLGSGSCGDVQMDLLTYFRNNGKNPVKHYSESHARRRRITRYMPFNQKLFPASSKPAWVERNQWILDIWSAVSAFSSCDHARYRVDVFEASRSSSWRVGRSATLTKRTPLTGFLITPQDHLMFFKFRSLGQTVGTQPSLWACSQPTEYSETKWAIFELRRTYRV